MRQLYGRGASELRVYIQQNTVVFDSTGNMQLANFVRMKFAEERRDIEPMVVRIALEIVDIQDQAATGSIDERIEKPGF